MKTINETLVVLKIIRERITDLKKLREQISIKETYYGSTERSVEPMYDVKKVDKKIVELQNFCTLADTKIKMSNAVTNIDIDINMESLLSSLE